MIEPGVYELKRELCKILGIPNYHCERRSKDLLEWLTNFYDYEILSGKPIRLKINMVYGEYQPLPKKVPNQNLRTQEKKERYEKYTIAALGSTFKPNSKSKIAREAIADFGYDVYGHSNTEAVTRRFIKEPFDKYGESDGKKKWVWFSSYEVLNEEELTRWRQIREEEKISDQEAANAFYRQEQGEDITKEKNSYKRAMQRIREEFKDTPVLVESWKLNNKV